jgi:hypothetical protein
MKTGFIKKTICAVLAAGILGSVAVEPVMAQRYDRRDAYVERYYRENGRDSDYRAWRRGEWSERDYRRWYRRHHRDNDRNNLGAAALFGLAAGALAGGLITRQPDTTGSVGTAVPPAGGYAPGTEGYLRYCSAKYRSFDPGTGTFMGNDGQRHYCR